VVDELLNQGKKIILVGDSAGATLAACVANARASYTGTQLLAQVLIYPALAHERFTRSMDEHANAPLLTKADMAFYHAIRVGGNDVNVSSPKSMPIPIPKQDPLYCPMQAQTFDGLPPSYLFPAQIDPLHDDCALYARALDDAGVKVENHTQIGLGLVHGYLRARHTSNKAAANFKKICETVLSLGRAEE
jgi:acetyl esterase